MKGIVPSVTDLWHLRYSNMKKDTTDSVHLARELTLKDGGKKTMVLVKRPINGVTLNPFEYILDDKGDVRMFKDEAEALKCIGFNSVEEAEDSLVYIEEVI
jgi:hypothetical protein